MNNFSLADLCCLFCFPPCPNSVAAKLAFLPPEPSYVLTQTDGSSSVNSGVRKMKIKIQNSRPAEDSSQPSVNPSMAATEVSGNQANTSGPGRETGFTMDCEQAEPFFVTTKRRIAIVPNRIVCLYMRANVPNPRYTILYSHGNAVDLGQMCAFFAMFSACLNCDIFSYDYSGYGRSSGRPSEQNLYADADAAWNSLRNLYNTPPEKIIIYGQSIGTVPSIDLAARYKCAGVVLHSPMVSGVQVACPGCTAIPSICDVFQSTPKIQRIKSYTLVIHGTNDEVIDISHGVTIFDRLRYPAEPLWVKGAGHNDIEMYDEFFQRIHYFVFHECGEREGANGDRPSHHDQPAGSDNTLPGSFQC